MMNFWQRFSSLARADAHGVLDAIEDPVLATRQALRDAAAEIARKRWEATKLSQERDALAKDLTTLRERRIAVDKDIDLALADDEMELARFAIRRSLQLAQEHDDLQQQYEQTTLRHDQLAQTLQRQELAYQQLEQRVQRFATQRREAKDPYRVPPTVVSDEDVEFELLRRRHGQHRGANHV